MLQAAMIATGGQYSNDTSVKRKSRILHDRCMKLMERREQETVAEPDRLCDYQAMFLLEFLSQYRARRAAKVLSSRFVKTYHKAFEDFRRTSMHLYESTTSLTYAGDPSSVQWQQWVELASWQRLLLACYILESQQTIFLARQPIPSLIGTSGHDLPFPSHLSTWDATEAAAWALACRQQQNQLQYVYDITSETIKVPLDDFQSSLLISAYHNRSEPFPPYMPVLPDFGFENNLTTSSTIKRQLSTARLVQVTPLRELLAVSGESWILSEKVPSVQALSNLKTTLRTWLVQLWCRASPESLPAPARIALRLSVKLLEDALQEQKYDAPLDVGSDMGIYYAALVLWAITTSAHTRVNGSHTTARSMPLRRNSEVPSHSHLQSLAPPNIAVIPRIARAVVRQPCDGEQVLSHAQITINTISFLSTVLYDFDGAPTLDSLAGKMRSLQKGCVSLLLWVKLRLRGIVLGVASSEKEGPINKPSDGLGELLEGITGSLERMLSKGWDEWDI